MGRRWSARVPAGNHGAALGRTGTTLVEVLVATLLLGILGAHAYGFVRAALASVRLLEVRAEAAGTAALAVDIWAQEVRLAGFAASGQRLTAVRSASATAVEVASDLNGDGDSDDPHELIVYAYDPSRRLVTRATAGGTAQPFAADVGAARFRYYDATARELVAPADGLSLDDRRRVRAIGFELQVAVPNPGPSAPGEIAVAAASTVHLRNP